MNPSIHLSLRATDEQAARLRALQVVFARACNALAPIVRQHRCWNRVGLHHLAYRQLREQFPELGSQMVCNAIYSVSRAARVVYQHPRSPFHASRLAGGELPLLHFLDNAPVYFDRHTLSLKAGRGSLYSLDGRMHFDLGLSPQEEQRFREEKLREIVLTSDPQRLWLTFTFAPPGAAAPRTEDDAPAEWPEHLVVLDADTSAHLPPGPALAPAPLLKTPLLPAAAR